MTHRLTLDELIKELPGRIVDVRSLLVESVVIDLGDPTQYYLQLSADEDVIYAEAIANISLDDQYALDLDAELKLLQLGWDPPRQERGIFIQENYAREWPVDTPVELVAMEILRTIVTVYMRDDDVSFELQYVGL